MDIQREKKIIPLWRKYWYVPVVLMLAFATYKLKSVMGDASFIVKQNELVTAVVEQGRFQVNVRATGVLKPVYIRWVSAQVSGRVEQAFVKAGAHVIKGQMLMQLSNPELHRELEKARWEFEAKKAENHAAYIALESQLLDLENSVVEADYSYQISKLKLDAETQLIAQKNATVLALDYQHSQLTVKQQNQYWLSQKQKVEKMKASLLASKTAQQARSGLVENNYQRIKDQVGGSVALIADQRSLFAELQVQENKVSDIALGQAVIVDTRSNKIFGKVIRIDPAVNTGMVQIDVQLNSELPNDARPDLTVDGLIEVSDIADTLYVKRPVFAPRYSDAGLYKLINDKKFAQKKKVKLGQSSVNQIQILSGLAVGDEIIISDTTSWQEHQEVMIN
ncbi:efflux RND transporter periplasmic adaptor subunit [Colwellia sp. BRX10-4]|uniref:efflux RND transporter periplasmic adaptor subunit n=1 Tax=Colwellia sp. BRX10-4 TaxID=2759843 RepID=UPI0015F5C6BC|nr:biotin/lipoyl-binding protein [Colwellia sp. BRX10-4]MBA6397033.1 HlyD family efflux transporter periplasmic adaptor subunit [Colwellia sp. BRX10-4]